MLSRAHRFHGHNALTFAYNQGNQVRGPQLTTRYALNPRRQSYRVAIVVSKKVSKSAVVRNRIRRRLYEIVRKQQILAPYDLIFMVYDAELATLLAPQLEQLVTKQLLKAGIITVVSE